MSLKAQLLTPETVRFYSNDSSSLRALGRHLSANSIDHKRNLEPRSIDIDAVRYVEDLVLKDIFSIDEDDRLSRLFSATCEFDWPKAFELSRKIGKDRSLALECLKEFEGLPTLDTHQVNAVALASHPEIPGLCIFDEQGLGKTVEALFAVKRLVETNSIGQVLIFAPKNMLPEWQGDLEKFFPGEFKCQIVSGTKSQKRAALDMKADVFVTNFETASSLEHRLRLLLQSNPKGTLMIVDESFFVKNADSKRTTAVQSLRDFAKRCLVLCGTPAPNDPKDIVEQFNLADQGATFGTISLPDDIEMRRQVIADRLDQHGAFIRRLKYDVMPELPTRQFITVPVKLAGVQARMYDDAKSILVNDLQNVSDDEFIKQRISFLARRAKLLQICSCPEVLDPKLFLNGAKSSAVTKLLQKLIEEQDEKVVLWSFYTASIERAMKLYADYNPVRIDGKVSSIDDRRDAVRRFQNDPEVKLFVANPAAAGAGLTLHASRIAVYESLSNQAAHYFQSLDRIHRRGQHRPVEYYLLKCEGTIEEAEHQRLRDKEHMAKTLLGDNTPPNITRQSLLEDLLV